MSLTPLTEPLYLQQGSQSTRGCLSDTDKDQTQKADAYLPCGYW
jgi:hypothetical protein